jgi:serine protease Do
MENKKRIGILSLVICIALVFASCNSSTPVNNSGEDTSSSVSSVEEASKVESEVSDDNASAEKPSQSVSEVLQSNNTQSNDEFQATNTKTSLADLYDFCIDSCVSVVCVVEKVVQGFWGEQVQEGTSLGSGFVIEGGYIVTNHHVIEEAKTIEVVFNDDDKIKATLVGSDKTFDIAVLKLNENKEVKPVKIGDSGALRIGEDVIAIGTPSSIEYAGSLTYGVISGLNRKIDVFDDNGKVQRTMYLIQTDATLNPGNSGGPLFNMKGEVVGVNNMKLVSSYEGIGFSIPINGAMDVVKALIEGKEAPDSDYAVSAAYLGISGRDVKEIKDLYNLGDEVPDGVFVTSVDKKSAIYKAGLDLYDVITEFAGVKITSVEGLKAELKKYNAGKEVSAKIFRQSRDGKTNETITITFKLDGVS